MTAGKLYIAVPGSDNGDVINTDTRSIHIGTDKMSLIDGIGRTPGTLVVMWTYTGITSLSGEADAVSWTELVAPDYVYLVSKSGCAFLVDRTYLAQWRD